MLARDEPLRMAEQQALDESDSDGHGGRFGAGGELREAIAARLQKGQR